MITEFINMLKSMNVKEIFVGKDFRFGKNAEGKISELKDYFDVHVVDIENIDGEKISTQRIADLIQNGEVKTANKLLGYNYKISGSVVHGKHIGTQIGFPTLNLSLTHPYILPKFGVYSYMASPNLLRADCRTLRSF